MLGDKCDKIKNVFKKYKSYLPKILTEKQKPNDVDKFLHMPVKNLAFSMYFDVLHVTSI